MSTNDFSERGEQPGSLIRGETHALPTYAGEYHAIDLYAPAPLGGAYALPGQELQTIYGVMPTRDVSQLGVLLPGNPEAEPDVMIYRSGTTPRRESGYVRALPQSVTTPDAHATFWDGSKGQTYG